VNRTAVELRPIHWLGIRRGFACSEKAFRGKLVQRYRPWLARAEAPSRW